MTAPTNPEALADEIEQTPWRDMVAPLLRICEVAAAFNQQAVFETDGAAALANVLKSMADKLDEAIAALRAASPVLPGELRTLSTQASPGHLETRDRGDLILRCKGFRDIPFGQVSGRETSMQRGADAAFIAACWNFVRGFKSNAARDGGDHVG